MSEHPECKPGKVSTLKWILHFMGCQNTTFNTRRHELALLSPGVQVTEEDVLESFRSSVDATGPEPWMLRLIQAGKLVVVLGDSVFVHGGLHDSVIGHLPGQGKVDKNIRDWAKALNAWKDSQVRDFLARPHWSPTSDGKGREGGAEDLILYGTPGFPDDATVIYHNPFRDGNPVLLSDMVEAYLAKNGVRRVFSGHQPHGQSPTVVRHPSTGLLRVTADTSYSCPGADKLFNPANMRGVAVSVIRLEGNALVIAGLLGDGRKHRCTLNCGPEQDELPDALVGRQLTDGSWVKTVLRGSKDEEASNVQTVLGRGFNLQTEDMHFGKACLKLKREFAVQQMAFPLKDVEPEWLVRSMRGTCRNFAAEEDTARRASTPMSHTFSREDFLKADTFIFNVGGVVDKVRSVSSSKTMSRHGTDLALEKDIMAKINDLIDEGKRVIFMSNNSNDSRKCAAQKLAQKGINIPAKNLYKQILNTSYTCAWFLRNAGVTNPFILASDTGILEELKEMGLKKYVATIEDNGTPKKEYLQAATFTNVVDLVKKAPDVDAVVVGWDRQLTTLKIDVATAYLTWISRTDAGAGTSAGRQIPLVACSSDTGGLLGNTPDDYLADRNFNTRMVKTVGNGLMAKIVCDTAGENMLSFDVGQPSDLMLEALTRPTEEQGMGVNPKKAVLIGDALSTDIAMANHGGMQSLLVFSGETQREDYYSKLTKGELSGHEMPTWVLNSFADF
mmetsp:Transcript_132633/g.412402  ORF Transcript_132633/g.412402 Transcript_132633/m.412402 type:complete len:729 (+) Transcript_132633:252-2438(+)